MERSMKPARTLLSISGAIALVFALCASTCEHTTEIIPFVKEVCNDVQDNDGDGLTDCQDSDCDQDCAVHVHINPMADFKDTDTVRVTGTHFKATGVIVSVSPSGTAGAATITGDTWSATVTQLNVKTTYTIQAIGSDAQGRSDTTTATVTRTN
jgi:hypothetical protein